MGFWGPSKKTLEDDGRDQFIGSNNLIWTPL